MRAQMGATPMLAQPLAENLTLLSGPGGNVVVLNGPDGKIVVDTFLLPAWPKLKETLDGLGELGYQNESPSLRNSYLAGAKELRDGVVPVKAAKAGSPDFVRGTTTELFLGYLGIQMDSRKAEGMKFKINLVTPDNGEKFVMEMSNSTLTALAGYQAKDAELTITIDRRDLEDVMVGTSKLAEKVAAGKAKMDGNPQVLAQLASTMVQFDNWFEVLPGTKKKTVEQPKGEVFLDDDPVVIRPEN